MTDNNKNSEIFRKIAQSRAPESMELKQDIEDGPYHPSDELLRQYINAELEKDDARIVMEHLALCRDCANESLRIRLQELELPLIEKVKDFVSSISLPVFIQSPGFAAVRQVDDTDSLAKCKVGDPLIIVIEAPAEGQIVVFYYCDETGQADLIFPYDSRDNPNVIKGQEVRIEGTVEGPPGIHGFKAIWSRNPLIDPRSIDNVNDSARKEISAEVINKLTELEESDWHETELEYEVVED